jgi:hypothetical protein
MAAWLQGYINGGATRRLARYGQSPRLGMRPPARRRHTLAHDRAIAHNNAAYGRVGPATAQAAPCQRKRGTHEVVVHAPVSARTRLTATGRTDKKSGSFWEKRTKKFLL